MDPVHEFSSADVEALRDASKTVHRAVARAVPPEESAEALLDPEPRGRWRMLMREPHDLLDAFPTLRLREGYELRLYVYRDQLGGRGIVLAGQRGWGFPDPGEIERTHGMRPGISANPEFMEAILLDGSPRSFLEASIFAREAEELGADWHGLDWSCETVLDDDPWSIDPALLRDPLSPREAWSWFLEPPPRWNPAVIIAERGMSTVRLITHSMIGIEQIYACLDFYGLDESGRCYRGRMPIARGVAGFEF